MDKEKKDGKPTVDIFEDEPVSNEDKKKKNRKDIEAEVLREENKKLAEEKSELNTKYLLALAETQNYKKRIDEEHSKFQKYATFSLAKEIVPLLDNFDLAIQKDAESKEMEAYLVGFKMIRNSLYQILEKEGVKELESLGKIYDPNTMNALAMVCDKTKKDQEVIQVYSKGYMYKDRVLRAANVVINSLEEDENKPQDEIEKNK